MVRSVRAARYRPLLGGRREECFLVRSVRAARSGAVLASLPRHLRAPGFLPDRRSLRSRSGRSASSADVPSGDLRCGPTTSLRSVAGPPRRHASGPARSRRAGTSRA